MLPSFAIEHAINRSNGYAHLFSDHSPEQPLRSQLADLTHAVSVQFQMGVASLLDFIHHIVRMGSEKQMVGPGAGRIVTTVQDIHSLGDFSEMQLPRDAVSKRSRERAGDNHEASIALAMLTPEPIPTGANLGTDQGSVLKYLGPETLSYGPMGGMLWGHWKITPSDVTPPAVAPVRGLSCALNFTIPANV